MLIIGVDADGCGDCLVCHYYTPHYYHAQGQSFLGHSGCTDVPQFIVSLSDIRSLCGKNEKKNNKCSLKLDLDPIQWETRSTGGCRWLSPSYPSVIIRLAGPNDTRNHCRPLVCCSAAVLARTSWFWRQMVAASAVTSGHAALQH